MTKKREEIEKLLPDWSATQIYNKALSDTADLLEKRIATVEEVAVFFIKFRQEFGFEPERDDDLREALQKEFIILKKNEKFGIYKEYDGTIPGECIKD